MVAGSFEGLLKEAREGQPGAIERLLGSYRQYLRGLARSWLHHSLRAKLDSSDAAQEALLHAFEGFGGFQGATEGEFAAWLRKVLARTLMDFTRRFHAQGRDIDREESLDAALAESEDGPDGLACVEDDSPAARARMGEMGVLLAKALSKLSAEHREVIVLRSLHELEWDEVGLEMGRSADAARMLWARAIAELRPHLDPEP
jgi:RNA polymerase sigma-70 factor (ECF subfamily)